MNVDSWHEAVFQCVAENNQGMSVTSTRVHVEGGCVKKKWSRQNFVAQLSANFCLLSVQISDQMKKIRRCLVSFAFGERKCLTFNVTLLYYLIQLSVPSSLCNGLKFSVENYSLNLLFASAISGEHASMHQCLVSVGMVAVHVVLQLQPGTRDEWNEMCLKRNKTRDSTQ